MLVSSAQHVVARFHKLHGGKVISNLLPRQRPRHRHQNRQPTLSQQLLWRDDRRSEDGLTNTSWV